MGSFDLVLRWKKQCILACIGQNFSEWNWSHKMSTNVCLAFFFGKSFFQNVSNTQERQQEPSSWPLASFSKAVKKLSLTRQAKFHPTCSPLCAILRQHKGTWNCRMLRQSAGKGMRFCGTGSTSYCQPHNVRDKWDLNTWIDCLGLIGWFKTRLLHIAFIGNFDHVQSSRIRLETSVKPSDRNHLTTSKCWKFRHLGNSVRHTTRAGSTKPTIWDNRETTWLPWLIWSTKGAKIAASIQPTYRAVNHIAERQNFRPQAACNSLHRPRKSCSRCLAADRCPAASNYEQAHGSFITKCFWIAIL